MGGDQVSRGKKKGSDAKLVLPANRKKRKKKKRASQETVLPLHRAPQGKKKKGEKGSHQIVVCDVSSAPGQL